MSRLEELIETLCPDGVEYKPFSEVCTYIRGITYNKSQEVKDDDINSHKVLRANNITLSNNMLNFNDVKLVSSAVHVKKEQYLYHGDILICAGSGSKEHIGKVAYIDKDIDYTFGGFMAVIRCQNTLDSRFLFHVLTGESFKKYLYIALNISTINNLSFNIIKSFKIPIPPLMIQHEIVRILDNFTELTEELTEELTAREQQYEYYLNVILNHRRNEWEKTTLKEVADVRDGTHDSPKQSDFGYKLATSKNISSGRLNLSTCYLISETDYNEINLRSQVNQYDILFSMIGTVGDVVIVMDEPCFAIKNMGLIKTKGDLLLSKYIFYWLQSSFSKAYIQSNLKGTAPKYISLALLRDFPIYLPTNTNEIKEIVNSIDSFNNLSTDLGQGLPAEIEARQKQYEYYRDKLLTFKEKIA